MKNLVVFGDSIPKGIIYEEGKIKKVKKSAVDVLGKYYRFDKVCNYSVYGQTLARLTKRGTVDEYLGSYARCDDNYAAICIGGNDADFDWKSVAKTPDGAHTSVTEVGDYCVMLDATIKKLVDTGHKVFLLTLPPVFSHLYFNNVIAKIADSSSVMRFLGGDVSNIYRHQELFNVQVIKCAYRNGIKLVDIRSALLADKDCSKKYCVDGVHPNQQGQSFLAETIIRYV